MMWILHESFHGSEFLSPAPLPVLSPPPPLGMDNFGEKISPNVLLVIVILAAIFFVSGLLHLLIRLLLRPVPGEAEDPGNSATALEGQLQQLFHLHDAGLDQSLIDNLPIFLYRAIIGLKEPFDCAVCLCEFEAADKLRLLPKCSHAFHIECIDTWLLSHSTCPLCRRSLLPDISPIHSCSPVVLVLESESENSWDVNASRREDPAVNSLLVFGEDDDFEQPSESSRKKGDVVVSKEEKMVPVKLGKFRSIDVGSRGSEEGSSSLNQRRCFSMGCSYEYVMEERCLLQVEINPAKRKPFLKRPGHRVVMSECDRHSKRVGFESFDESKYSQRGCNGSNATIASAACLQKKESFSVSKIWLQTKEQRTDKNCSRRAFSFRLPLHKSASVKSVEEIDVDLEVGSCTSSLASQMEATPSFARRTLLWIMGKQNRVGSNY
ncbi:hypothetical protein HPP92_016570 [Vanilla planifolia]|uniref:RING-type E3 ubiquitin transferase n=1 Tax=Vanilla planifolia TaxID=51239 RepID=A0A835QGC4_VANPL|nr:hypothetical protein HPP92_016570 [Vanilla planifolia]